MNVSVIIPAYNEEKYLRKCLESLRNQIEKPDEIIVVDNNCTDKTVEIAQEFDARIIQEKKQGMIYARNAGYDNAKYEILARTDADAILPPDWILKIKKAFGDPNLGGFSGPATYFTTPVLSEISSFVAFLVISGFGLLFGHPTMFGPNMTIKKSMWEKIRNDVCLRDCDVHEDIDLSIHLAKIAKIRVDRSLVIRSRRGRWLKLCTEYIVRLIKMLRSHRNNRYKAQ